MARASAEDRHDHTLLQPRKACSQRGSAVVLRARGRAGVLFLRAVRDGAGRHSAGRRAADVNRAAGAGVRRLAGGGV